ncbi:MAG: helix-turn-helix domain-containing protein [Microvirga sp.]
MEAKLANPPNSKKSGIDSSGDFPSPLLTPEDAARFLNLSTSYLAKARMPGGNGPRYSKFGRAVRYALEDLIEWVRARARRSTSEK